MSAEASDDPLYCVTRVDKHGARDVIIRWSEMTDAERERAWADHEKLFGSNMMIRSDG